MLGAPAAAKQNNWAYCQWEINPTVGWRIELEMTAHNCYSHRCTYRITQNKVEISINFYYYTIVHKIRHTNPGSCFKFWINNGCMKNSGKWKSDEGNFQKWLYLESNVSGFFWKVSLFTEVGCWRFNAVKFIVKIDKSQYHIKTIKKN